MSMSHQRADAILNEILVGTTEDPVTPHIWLHKGNPGEAGTANVADAVGEGDIDRKAITFGAPGNVAEVEERSCLSTSLVSWSGAEIDAGQEITHFSIWAAGTGGTPEFLEAVETAKTVGSDGVTIASGDVEVAIGVFVKPA